MSIRAIDPETGTTVPVLHELSPSEADALAQASEPLANVDIERDTDWYCRAARRASRELPITLKDDLDEFSHSGSEAGIIVFRNADVGPVPSTPPDNSQGLGRRTLLASESAVLIEQIAELVGYEAEAEGAMQQDMVPNMMKQYSQESQGSRCTLEAHTEQCFSPLKPDFVVLACLRGDPAAATYSFTARQLVSHLSPGQVDLLRKPLWTSLIDSSFQPHVPDPHDVRGPFPILSGPHEDPSILIDQDLMHGITAAAQHLLKEVVSLYETHRNSHVLQRGDILILDNHRAMHGRSSFQPQFDGGDRFIVRSMAVRDLRRTAYARQGRRISARFS